MTSLNCLIEQYADLYVRVGLNVQPGQTVFLGAFRGIPVENADFIRMVAEKAYDAGARRVHVNFGDDHLTRIHLSRVPEEALADVPTHMIRWYEEAADGGAAFGSITGSSPDALAGIEPSRIARAGQAMSRAMSGLSAMTGAMKISWCIIAVPTADWAAKVLPDLPPDQQVEGLWHQILKASRVTGGDPIQAWQEHIGRLAERRGLLNRYRFSRLHLRSTGTDLTVDLPQKHEWVSVGSTSTPDGNRFVPNIPSEEVFTVPHRTGVNGVVRSTMPLNLGGTTVRGIMLRLENGRIVEFDAESGRDVLKGIIETDEGSRFLGEIALVPVDSPIAQTGLLYYNTLYDENASVHIAIGRGLPPCIQGGSSMTPAQLEAEGLNVSAAHLDFMIGSDAMEIDGESADGRVVPVFRSGRWAV